MKIISHRGFWHATEEKNQRVAFERSVAMRFGIETDIRDYQGTLVISHDIPTGNEITLTEFLDIVGDSSITLAMNIKSDGLALPFKSIMERKKIKKWFAFDMSIPDMRSYAHNNLAIFTRLSELEPTPVLLDKSAGIWLDAFNSTWYTAEQIKQYLDAEKFVCVVSPELHQRDHQNVWEILQTLASHPNLLLCTDFPDKAQSYFGVKND